MKVDEFFQVLNTKKTMLNDACNCNCAMEVLDEAELRLFMTNVEYMQRSILYNKYTRQNRVLVQLVAWLKEEFSSGGQVTERSFRNAMVGFFMKEKVKLINKLITTFNDSQTRNNLKQPRAYSMWGDTQPEEPDSIPKETKMKKNTRQRPRPTNRGAPQQTFPVAQPADSFMNQQAAV